MKFTKKQIDELIQHLNGGCKTLDEGINDLFGDDYSSNDLSSDDFESIYSEIFLCKTCGWWCEITDESEDEANTCVECHNE